MPRKKEYPAKDFVALWNKNNKEKIDKGEVKPMNVSRLNYLRLKNDGSVKFRKVYDTFVYHE